MGKKVPAEERNVMKFRGAADVTIEHSADDDGLIGVSKPGRGGEHIENGGHGYEQDLSYGIHLMCILPTVT